MNRIEDAQPPGFPFEDLGYRFSVEGGAISVEDMRLSLLGQPIHVTSRTWEFYNQMKAIPPGQLEMVLRSDRPVRVCSIGAGLDDTTEYLAVLGTPPVIIDPMRRHDLYSGLEHVSEKNISSRMHTQVDVYLYRLELMMSNGVMYLEKTFEDALLENADILMPNFDVVIDVRGAFWNPGATHIVLKDSDEIREKEQTLLDPSGLMFYWNR